MQNRLVCCLAFCLALGVAAMFFGTPLVNAQDSPDATLSVQQKRKQNTSVVPSPKQQVVIKEFVKKHHPELVELLDRLEVRRPAIYTQAIKDVAKSHKRLMNVQKNNPDRYEAALELWKVRSRIHVASARVAISDSPEHRDQLEELVGQQIKLRIQQLKLEQRRTQQRLQKIQEQIAKFGGEGDSVREARIEKETKFAINRLRRMSKKSKKQIGSRSDKSGGQRQSQNEKLEAGDGSQ